MKVEAHIKLEKELLDAVDSLSGGESRRSEFIEEALRAYLRLKTHRNKRRSDLEIINEHAEELNQEAMDVLDYQIAL
jgi:metal-responsive CopG/Arc/MetJ family transcriptional regulator